jgi:hypothetical protein
VGFEATSIDDYSSTAPNPVSFLVALLKLANITEEYSRTVCVFFKSRLLTISPVLGEDCHNTVCTISQISRSLGSTFGVARVASCIPRLVQIQ